MDKEKNILELRNRALDAAIAAMARNRVLIFTLNLIAAIVLITVYLESGSFDESYRGGYLFALDNAYSKLHEEIPDSLLLSGTIEDDLNKIEKWAVAVYPGKNKDKEWMLKISKQILRIYRIKNEMNLIKLPESPSFPFGFAIPRNDLVPIAGLLMVLLYAWLKFSFNQLARIVNNLKDFFKNDDDDVENNLTHNNSNEDKQSLFTQIISMHYLFRTSEGGASAWLVRALYFSPPFAMIVALINDLHSLFYRYSFTDSFRGYLIEISLLRLILVASITMILCFIAYQIHFADSHVNKSSYNHGEDNDAIFMEQ